MVLLSSGSSLAPSVHPTLPPSSLFSSLSNNPPALSPPTSDHTLAHPFTINPDVYNAMLHVGWPIIISVVYTATVRYLNRINKQRDYQPWPFSKSLTFYVSVLAHNVILALYSGWTFAGMFNAIRRSWPGWNGDYGLAGAADALCKLHGPRGPGSAATYDTRTGSWGISDISMRLFGGAPDSTDVGRLWNEGLAFYGWLFYISKFYEVIDTMIILSKGKESSLLQTYHHAGAMFAMWAGIRYMSPPIWMFTFINSGLHTLMYTYYTLSALTIQIPPFLKRTLTFLQIVQIIFGGSYALAHLFVAYDVPHYATYRVVNNLSTSIPSAASTASSAIASTMTSANLGSWLKKAALRAAGEEGLAENVRNYQGETFGVDAIRAADVQKAQEEINYRLEMTKTHCLDTSGEVFAILLNVLYLTPLAYMFVAFFARYFQARAHGHPKPSIGENAAESTYDSGKEVARKIAEAMDDKQGGQTGPPENLKAELEEAKDRAKETAKDVQHKSNDISEKVQNDLKDLRAKVQQKGSDAKEIVKDCTPEMPANTHQRAKELGSKASDVAQHVNDYAKDRAKATKDVANEMANKAKDQTSKAADSAADDSKDRPDQLAGNSDADSGDTGGKEGHEEPGSAEEKDIKEDGAEDDDVDALEASAYEINPDMPKTEEEKKAEEKMQPNGT